MMHELAKRGTSGTLLAHGWCGKVLFVAVVGVVHFTAQLRRARVITRSSLPGCHGPLVRFDATTLSSASGTVFSLVPLHLANIFVGLLCANHMTDRFGKGITSAWYRLTAQDILATGSESKQLTKQSELPAPHILCQPGTEPSGRIGKLGSYSGRFMGKWSASAISSSGGSGV